MHRETLISMPTGINNQTKHLLPPGVFTLTSPPSLPPPFLLGSSLNKPQTALGFEGSPATEIHQHQAQTGCPNLTLRYHTHKQTSGSKDRERERKLKTECERESKKDSERERERERKRNSER